MATHSITLAWEIPWTEKPGGLQSVHGVTKSQGRRSTGPVHADTQTAFTHDTQTL